MHITIKNILQSQIRVKSDVVCCNEEMAFQVFLEDGEFCDATKIFVGDGSRQLGQRARMHALQI